MTTFEIIDLGKGAATAALADVYKLPTADVALAFIQQRARHADTPVPELSGEELELFRSAYQTEMRTRLLGWWELG